MREGAARIAVSLPRVVTRVVLSVVVLTSGWPLGSWHHAMAQQRPGAQQPRELPPKQEKLEVLVGDEIKKVWTAETLKAILNLDRKGDTRVKKVVTVADLLAESGIARERVSLVRIVGTGWSVDVLELRGESLARLERLVLEMGSKGWHVTALDKPDPGVPRQIRSVRKIEVTLEP